MNSLLRCPVCGEQTLLEGEIVDVGFGLYNGVKCGPDTCDNCGYIEAGPDPNDLPIEHYKDCWKNGLDPHPIFPTMKRDPIQSKYVEWIQKNIAGDGYGKCEEASRNLQAAFPELRIIYGLYYCFVWGDRHHFWCLDPYDNIVDPTAAQFPSQGKGVYSIKYFVPSDKSVGTLGRIITPTAQAVADF